MVIISVTGSEQSLKKLNDRYKYKYWIKVILFLISLFVVNYHLEYLNFSFTRGNLHGEVGFETGIAWMMMTTAVCKWCDMNTSCCVLGATAVSFANMNANFTIEDYSKDPFKMLGNTNN